MFAIQLPASDVFVSTLYFALFIVWIIVIFTSWLTSWRSHDLSGAAKAAWVTVHPHLPLVGSLIYCRARRFDARAPDARRRRSAERRSRTTSARSPT